MSLMFALLADDLRAVPVPAPTDTHIPWLIMR
jgi:hypothetical protein